eukprot:g35124.t1
MARPRRKERESHRAAEEEGRAEAAVAGDTVVVVVVEEEEEEEGFNKETPKRSAAAAGAEGARAKRRRSSVAGAAAQEEVSNKDKGRRGPTRRSKKGNSRRPTRSSDSVPSVSLRNRNVVAESMAPNRQALESDVQAGRLNTTEFTSIVLPNNCTPSGASLSRHTASLSWHSMQRGVFFSWNQTFSTWHPSV